MLRSTPETASPARYDWKVGDLVYVEHTPSPPLTHLAIAEVGLVYSIYADDDANHPLGVLTRSGRVIRVSPADDQVQFLHRTSFKNEFQYLADLRDAWKKGQFDDYFDEADR